MRKGIILLVMFLALVLTGILIVKGNSNVPSYKVLGEQDKKLQEKIIQLDNLQKNEYQKSEDKLKKVMQEYEEKKKEYNEKIEIAKRNGANGELQIEKYRQEFIWATLGIYAKEKGVDLKIEITPSKGIEISEGFQGEFALYDFKVEAVGDYKQIEGFLYSLEGDDKFKARLNDFSLSPNIEEKAGEKEITKQQGTDIKKASEKIYTNDLKAKFTIKNVPLDTTGISKTTKANNPDVKTQNKDTKKTSTEQEIINNANDIGNSGSPKDIKEKTKQTINN